MSKNKTEEAVAQNEQTNTYEEVPVTEIKPGIVSRSIKFAKVHKYQILGALAIISGVATVVKLAHSKTDLHLQDDETELKLVEGIEEGYNEIQTLSEDVTI